MREPIDANGPNGFAGPGGPGRPLSAANDAGLHLAEHEKALVPRHQVELPEAGAEVPRDYLAPTRLEMPRREPLPVCSELPPWVIGHAGDARAARRTRG